MVFTVRRHRGAGRPSPSPHHLDLDAGLTGADAFIWLAPIRLIALVAAEAGPSFLHEGTFAFGKASECHIAGDNSLHCRKIPGALRLCR